MISRICGTSKVISNVLWYVNCFDCSEASDKGWPQCGQDCPVPKTAGSEVSGRVYSHRRDSGIASL